MTSENSQLDSFPWESVLAYGLGCLRLHPNAFWALSLREFSALAARGFAPDAAMVRSGLAAMMAKFPDGEPHG